MEIKTNNQWRELLSYWELSAAQRTDFDYNGADEGSYFMYKGRAHALAEYTMFNSVWSTPTVEGDILHGWHASAMQSAWTGTVIKVSDCGDAVTVGYYYS